MIDLNLYELKMLNASLAEGTIGIEQSGKWNPVAAYTQDLSPERSGCLLHLTEQRALAWIAQRLPQNGRVVEVGSFMGCSAAIMSHANPSLRIVSIDLFDTDNDHERDQMQAYYADLEAERIAQFLGQPGLRRTLARLQQRLAHYPNIELVQGSSPDAFVDSDLDQIDLYFEDAQHRDPGLTANIDFWEPRVRPGGLILLHDYRPWLPETYGGSWPLRFPDVEQALRRLLGQGWRLEGRISGLAILSRP